MAYQEIIMDGVKCNYDAENQTLYVDADKLGEEFSLGEIFVSSPHLISMKKVHFQGQLNLERLDIMTSDIQVEFSELLNTDLHHSVKAIMNHGAGNKLNLKKLQSDWYVASPYSETLTFENCSINKFFTTEKNFEQQDIIHFTSCKLGSVCKETKEDMNSSNHTSFTVDGNTTIGKFTTFDSLYNLTASNTAKINELEHYAPDAEPKDNRFIRVNDNAEIQRINLNGPTYVIYPKDQKANISYPAKFELLEVIDEQNHLMGHNVYVLDRR